LKAPRLVLINFNAFLNKIDSQNPSPQVISTFQ